MAESKQNPPKSKGEKTRKASPAVRKSRKMTKTQINLEPETDSIPRPIQHRLAARVQKFSKNTIRLLSAGTAILLLGVIYLFLPQPTLHSHQQNSITEEGQMTLRFNQRMNKSSVEANVNVQPELNGSWIWTRGNQLSFRPNEPLRLNESYRIDLSQKAKNWYGKPLKHDFSFAFTVSGPPAVSFVSPYGSDPAPENESAEAESAEANLPVIDLHQPITVLFDQPMDWEAMNPEDLLVIQPKVEGEFTFLAERAFEFTPTQWPPKSTIKLTVPEGLMAQNGLKTGQAFEWQVQTPGQRIVNIAPNPKEPIAIDQPLEITFQLPVKLDDIRPGENIQLFPSNDFNASQQEQRDGFFNTEVTYKPNDPLTLVFKPEPPYQPETEYELVFKAGLAELEEDFSLKFRTGLEGQAAIKNPSQSAEAKSPLKSFPAGFAPQVLLEEGMQAPLAVELCKLPPEVNPLALPPALPSPCAPAQAVLENLNGSSVNLGELYPQETWGNGIYWVKMRDQKGRVELNHLLMSDTTLILKRAGEDVLVWALDRLTQEPVPRLEIQVYSPDGKELARGVTDGGGIYKSNQQLTESVYVVGTKKLEGENRWSVAADRWPMEVNSTSSVISTAPQVYLITDRNQLQAGETLKFKGLWRTPTPRGYALPWMGEITLKLFDSQGKEMLSQGVGLKDKASFDGELVLPQYLTPGLYRLQGFEAEKPLSTLSAWIKVNQQTSVEELYWVKKPDFTSKAPQGVVQLRTASGLPAVAESGRWILYQHNPFNPLHTQIVTQGEFDFNASAQGEFAIQWENDNPLKPNTTYSLEISTSHPTLPVIMTHTFDYEPKEYAVELHLDHAVLGENAAMKGYIVASEENSMSSVELRLYPQGEKKPIWERRVELTESTHRFDYNDLTLPNLESGIYDLKAFHGRTEVSESKKVYVAKDLTQPIDDKLAVFLSHENREVNTKSKLLLNVPEASLNAPITVLLSYEQAGLLDYDVIVAEQPLNVIDFSVQPSMNPGVYISALAIGYEENGRLAELKKELRQLYQQREEEEKSLDAEKETLLAGINANIATLESERRQLRSGLEVKVNSTQVYLPVDENRKELDLKLNLEPPEGGKGRYRLQVQTFDEFQNPASASVTLLVRPKSHFFLSPMDYFLSLPAFNVSTHSNLLLNRVSELSRSEGGEGFKNLIHPFHTSSNLIFEPLLLTNETGQLAYEFEFPTRDRQWEIVAFANTQENQWGSARTDLPMTQTVSLSPILPSVLTVGDSTELQVELQNHSDITIESRLTVEAPALSLQGETDMAIQLPAGESKLLRWPLKVQSAGAQEAVQFTFNGQNYSFPVTIHPASEGVELNSNVFAWLHFTSPENGKPVTSFQQGKAYHGHLTLMTTTGVKGAIQQQEEGELVQLPFSIRTTLPAGLKAVSWLPPLNEADWAEKQKQWAEMKGVSWIHNPMGFFSKRQLLGNQLLLESMDLPAGVYQFDFEVQSLWPGQFKMPALQWGEEWVRLEEDGLVGVK